MEIKTKENLKCIQKYANRKIIPVETTLGMWGGEDKEE
jgi:hypothetical protein